MKFFITFLLSTVLFLSLHAQIKLVPYDSVSVKSENLLKGLNEEKAIEDLIERVEVPSPKETA